MKVRKREEVVVNETKRETKEEGVVCTKSTKCKKDKKS